MKRQMNLDDGIFEDAEEYGFYASRRGHVSDRITTPRNHRAPFLQPWVDHARPRIFPETQLRSGLSENPQVDFWG